MTQGQQKKALLPEIKDMTNSPQLLNMHDRAFWVLGWNECRDAAKNMEARIAELEAELEAVGAGGVEPLRKQAAQAVHQIAEPAAPVGKPIEDAIDALVMAAFTEGGCSEHRMSEARIQTELRKKELCTLIAATQPTAQGMEAKDAARYRFLRDGDWRENDDVAPCIHLQLNALWDKKIDAALAAQAKQGGV